MIALGCLSGVIASFSPRTLNIQEVDVMTAFYCDRLEDEVSTKENIAGLSALQDMPGFGAEEVTKVCEAYSPRSFVLIIACLMMWICRNIFNRQEWRYIL
jgi:Dos2-interacting transcription regulator of RNA-Pol-II